MRKIAPKTPKSLGAYLLLALTLGWIGFVVLMPLAAVFREALRKGSEVALAAVSEPDAISAVRLTLLVSAICVALNATFGLVAAWAVAKFEFRGKGFLLTLIDLPFSLSPVVSGLVWVLLFGASGWLGPTLAHNGMKVIFALASAFWNSCFSDKKP